MRFHFFEVVNLYLDLLAVFVGFHMCEFEGEYYPRGEALT